VVRCYSQFRKELRTHVYQHDQPSLITLPAPTQQSIAQGQKQNREKTGTIFCCPLDKERAISTFGLTGAAPTGSEQQTEGDRRVQCSLRVGPSFIYNRKLPRCVFALPQSLCHRLSMAAIVKNREQELPPVDVIQEDLRPVALEPTGWLQIT
jgi:hypothetical protein